MTVRFPQRLKQAVEAFRGVTTSPRYNAGNSTFIAQLASLDPSKEPIYLNSVVASLINFVWTSFSQVELEIFTKDTESDQDEIYTGPVRERIKDIYEGNIAGETRDALEFGIALSLVTEGTAFLYKVRDGSGACVGLQYLTHTHCSFDSDEIIRYTSDDGSYYRLPRTDVIVLKYGRDPKDSRRGFTPLKAVLREILGDQEASEYVRAVLQNFGVLGLVFSPKGETQVDPSTISAIKANLRAMTTGSNRGNPMMFGSPMDVTTIDSNPKNMMLGELRKDFEQRICAAFNVPSVALQLASGLDVSTYNNVKTLVRVAWDNFLIPFGDRISRQLTSELLTEFLPDPLYYLGYDRRRVDALQDDLDQMATRISGLFQSGIIMLNEARKAMDFEPAENDGFFYDLTSQSQIQLAKARHIEAITHRANDRTEI